jgi:CarboxypepD_reg-like domain/TonB dependent receptor/TonB-dependent Receptor Plug Domain
MKFKLSTLIFFFTLVSFAQKGTVTGTLSDKDLKNEPLPFANVTIKGTTLGATTDIKGKYAIELEAGNHIIVFSFLGYESKEVAFTIKSGEQLKINESIGSGSVKMEDVVVKATTVSREKETALLLDQKKAVEIKQSIGAQEMTRKGVSDVEEGLTKITGISKVDGRGLFVRGLEDRYNNLLINDLAVPSNNPFKKIIPLDIFPTDIVSIIETYKTFNTNLYGDFAGGTFNIITSKGEKSQTKINMGAGFTTNNNLEKFLISKDANSTSDFFGFSGNERDLPKALGKAPSGKTLSSDESLNQFGSGYDVDQSFSPLNTSFSMSHSEKFNIGEKQNSLKYLLSLNFDNKYQVREGVNRFFNTAQGNYDNNLNFTQYKYATNASTLIALNYKSNRLNLTSNTFYLKTTDNVIQDQIGSTNGTTVNSNAFIRINELQETTYLNSQLFGNYKLTENERHNLKVGVSYTKTDYELPDRKSFKGVKLDDNTTSVSYTGNSLFRQYLDFNGKYHASGLLEYNWNFGNENIEKAHKLTLGYNGYINNMESSFRFLISKDLATNLVSFDTNKPDASLANEIKNGNFTYAEGTNSTYKAKLNEFVNAGYFDIAFKFGESFNLNIGTRVEQTNRETKFRESGSFDDPFKTKKIDKIDFLPTLNSKYKVNENSNIRFAGAKTITRPVIMESYPLEFVNPDGTIEQGNPNIINSENYNLDLKYELFPSTKELVVVSLFSKFIQNPIERVFQPSAGSGGQIISYDNSKTAVLYGAEFEFLFELARISNTLKDFSFGLNTSLMHSKVTINTINSPETIAINNSNPSRKLQGASPWIVNADLKYEFDFSKNWQNTMTLVYNVYGKRIFAVGTNGLDNYNELSFSKLDFVWNNKLSKKWDVKLSADNILNPLYKIELGSESKIKITETDLTIKDYKKGIGFSLNLSYTF